MSTSAAARHTRPTEPEAALPAWKTELNAKLEAHRQRRGLGSAAHNPVPPQQRETPEDASRAVAARVAARVAERYAKAPSYREVMAANAAAAAAAAEMAVAAVAAAEAHQAAHQAAHDLLSDLAAQELARQTVEELRSAPVALLARTQPTVEHPLPLPARTAPPERAEPVESRSLAIVDAFAEAEVPPATQLPAKLIEFPRELVAARKSRPRIAEGPLAEAPEAEAWRLNSANPDALFPGTPSPEPSFPDASPLGEPAAGANSLRIFEVQHAAEQGIESTREAFLMREDARNGGASESRPSQQTHATQWQSIRLGEHPSLEPGESREDLARPRNQQAEAHPAPLLHVASIADRGMAALVDFAIVTAAFLLFVLVFASCTAHPPLNKAALACAGMIFAALLIFYQWLFLSYGAGTPGMRYAQIALCTFNDENPTRTGLRRRVWASLLATLPLGLGLVWAVFDEDALGWHDRISRTYQRSYR